VTEGELAELQNNVFHAVRRGDGLLEVVIRVSGDLPDVDLERLADALSAQLPVLGGMVTFRVRPMIGDVLTGRVVIVGEPWS